MGAGFREPGPAGAQGPAGAAGAQGPAGPNVVHTAADVQAPVDGQSFEWDATAGLYVPRKYLRDADKVVLPRNLSDLARTGGWLPQGMVDETFPRYLCMAQLGIATGRIQWTGGIVVPGGTPINTVYVLSSTAATAPTHQWVALMDRANGAVVKLSGDKTNEAWGANVLKPFALTSTYTPANAVELYVGVVVVATAVPNFWRPGGALGSAVGAGGGYGDNGPNGLVVPGDLASPQGIPGGQHAFYACVAS